MTLRVEMEYRLLLAIDMSLYGYKKIIKIIFGGCAKFHPLAFFTRSQTVASIADRTASQ